MDVLDERVKPILMSLCGTKKADEFVFVNSKTKKPYTGIKKAFASACQKAGVHDLEWHDLRATLRTRLALAGYDALTIKAIMGHRDMRTTERDIRANRFTQEVVFQRVPKLATKEERPPLQVAVSA